MSREELLACAGLADVLIDRGDLDKAREALLQAERPLKVRPNSGFLLLVRRARIARMTGDFERIPELLAGTKRRRSTRKNSGSNA